MLLYIYVIFIWFYIETHHNSRYMYQLYLHSYTIPYRVCVAVIPASV